MPGSRLWPTTIRRSELPRALDTGIISYPSAEQQSVVDDLHGHLVRDPYRWLENPVDPAAQSWLAAQEELWRSQAAELPDRAWWHARVGELTSAGMVTAPVWRGQRQFFLRQAPGQEHPVLYVVHPDGTEEVLLDLLALDPGATTTLDCWQPDHDGRLLAFQLSRRGDERSELYVLDVDARRVVDGPIDRCRYSPVCWLPGGEAFYFVRALPGRPASRRIYLHRVGTPGSEDALIFGSGRDETTAYGLGISQDGRWLVISASRATAAGNDLWLADLPTSAAEQPRLRVVQDNAPAQTVLTVGGDGRMYVLTTRAAPRGRLCVGDPADPRPVGWFDLIAADSEAVISDFTILDGPDLTRSLLLVSWVRHAVSELSVHDLASGERLGTVPLPGAGSVGSITARPQDSHEVWFTYTDSVTPVAVYRYDARTGTTTRWAGAPGSVQVPDVEVRQITCISADGTPIRVVVSARPAETPGPRPAILYGYGGFGRSLTPTYSSYALAWVEAGGVFATANLRGGGEEGEQWHRDGMLERKQNVFDDFIAAAESLVAGGWTTPAQLGITGESNGGLLVGAVLTQRPDLFAAAVCSAPLLDMIRYERSGFGPRWTGEYGSAADPEQFRVLLSYSPYHRVCEDVDYPAVLFTVFGGDSRVDPLHARKMCAALQRATGSQRPILLRHEDEVGHGARAVSRAIGLAGDLLAFLAAHTGLRLPDPAGTGAGEVPAEDLVRHEEPR